MRMRATIAVLDDDLKKPVMSFPPDWVRSLRQGDVPSLLEDFEQETATLSAQSAAVCKRRDEELRVCTEWVERRRKAEGDGRADLASQAEVRETAHQHSANELTRECEAFAAQLLEYGEITAALRQRAEDNDPCL